MIIAQKKQNNILILLVQIGLAIFLIVLLLQAQGKEFQVLAKKKVSPEQARLLAVKLGQNSVQNQLSAGEIAVASKALEEKRNLNSEHADPTILSLLERADQKTSEHSHAQNFSNTSYLVVQNSPGGPKTLRSGNTFYTELIHTEKYIAHISVQKTRGPDLV